MTQKNEALLGLRGKAFAVLQSHQNLTGLPLSASEIPNKMGRSFVEDAATKLGVLPRVKLVMEALGAIAFREPDGQPNYATPDYTPTPRMIVEWEARRTRFREATGSSGFPGPVPEQPESVPRAPKTAAPHSATAPAAQPKLDRGKKSTEELLRPVVDNWLPSDCHNVDEFELVKRNILALTWKSHEKFGISLIGSHASTTLTSHLTRLIRITSTSSVPVKSKQALLRTGLILVSDARDPLKLPTYAAPGFIPLSDSNSNRQAYGAQERPAYFDPRLTLKRQFLVRLCEHTLKNGPATTGFIKKMLESVWSTVIKKLLLPSRARDEDIVSMFGAVAVIGSTGKCAVPRLWEVPREAFRNLGFASNMPIPRSPIESAPIDDDDELFAGLPEQAARAVKYLVSVGFESPEAAGFLGALAAPGAMIEGIPERVFISCARQAIGAKNVWAITQVLRAAQASGVEIITPDIIERIAFMYCRIPMTDKLRDALDVFECLGYDIPARLLNSTLAASARVKDRQLAMHVLSPHFTCHRNPQTDSILTRFDPPVE